MVRTNSKKSTSKSVSKNRLRLHWQWYVVFFLIIAVCAGVFLLLVNLPETFTGQASGQGMQIAVQRNVPLFKYEEAAGLPSFRSLAYNQADVGDINNDGLIDIVIAESTEVQSEDHFTNEYIGWKNRVYLNKGNQKFDDVTHLMLVGEKGYQSTDAALGDLNNDGRLDLVASNLKQKTAFFIQENNVFVDVSDDPLKVVYQNALPETYKYPKSRGADIADLDNDGDNDVFITEDTYSTIYENLGPEQNYRLEDRTPFWNSRENSMVTSFSPVLRYLANHGNSAIDKVLIHDFNNDGFVDLAFPTSTETFAGQGYNDTLYLNVENVNAREGDSSRVFYYDPCFQFPEFQFNTIAFAPLDWDGDGLLDIYAVFDNAPPRLYHNIYSEESYQECRANNGRNVVFDDILDQTQLPNPIRNGFEQFNHLVPEFSDMNNDGRLDVLYRNRNLKKYCGNNVMANGDCRIKLFIQQGDGSFLELPTENIEQPRLGQPIFPELIVEDFDNDRDNDLLYVTTSTHVVFNDGANQPTFLRSTSDLLPYTTDSMISSGTVIDLNNDGIKDIFSTNLGYSFCTSSCSPKIITTPYKYFLSTTVNGQIKWDDAFGQIVYPQPYDSIVPQLLSPCFGDVDNDGDTDAVIPAKDTETFVFLNDGRGRLIADIQKLPLDPYRNQNPPMSVHRLRNDFTVDNSATDPIPSLNGVVMDGDNVIQINPVPYNPETDAVDKVDGWRNYQLTSGLLGPDPTHKPFGAGSCVIKDFNGDNRPDLFLGYFYVRPDRFFINEVNGNGWGFVEQNGLPQKGAAERNIFTLDIDKDGDEDIISYGHVKHVGMSVSVYLNDRTGNFVIADNRRWFVNFDPLFIDTMKMENIIGDSEPEIIFVRFFRPNDVNAPDGIADVPAGYSSLSIYVRSQKGGPYQEFPISSLQRNPAYDRTEVYPEYARLNRNWANINVQDVSFPDINNDGLKDIVLGKQVLKERVFVQTKSKEGSPLFIEVTDEVIDPRNFKNYYMWGGDIDGDKKDEFVEFDTGAPHLYQQQPIQKMSNVITWEIRSVSARPIATPVIKYLSCVDSDNGVNTAVKGTVSATISQDGVRKVLAYTDVCGSSGKLAEYSCSADGIKSVTTKIACLNCVDGACLS